MSAIRKEVTIGNSRLILGDCLEVLPLLGKVDAVVTDPPYGMNANTKTRSSGRAGSKEGLHGRIPILRDWKAVHGDDRPFDPQPWLKFPVAVLFGANHFSHSLPGTSKWLIWDKRRGGTSDDNADCEIAWTNARGPARLFSHLWRGMVRDSETTEPRLHPTQKPVALMEWVLKNTTLDGSIILDPYMGSGTTGVACVKLGRSFIGVEIDEGYFEIACERIRKAHAQPDMFVASADRPAEPTQEALL